MTLPAYPEHDYNRGAQLLQQLGSFWVNIFAGVDKLQANLRSSGQERGQTYLDTLEAIYSLSRLTVPVFHTENWFLLTLRKSDAGSATSVYRPDDLEFGPQDGLLTHPTGFIQAYGGVDRTDLTRIPLPATLVDAKYVIQNFVLHPSKVWVNGVDYVIEKDFNTVTFTSNLFNDPMVPKRSIFDANGVVVDEELALWVFRGEFDLQNLYIQFGYAVGVQLESSESAKTLLNAYWDMLSLGPSLAGLQSFLSAMAGSPNVIGPTETVEFIRLEPAALLIMTDKQVYSFSPNATAVVDVGDVVFSGQALVDAVIVAELSGANPDYSLLPAISLSSSFLGGAFMADLTFQNHTVALDYLGLDSDNKAIVRIETSGFPSDVEDFWNAVQAAGKLPGRKTLAEYLDTRLNPTDQPGPLALPSTVNPMQFVISNLMRNNLFAIRIKLSSFAANALGLSYFKLLRDVIPPHTTFFVFIDVQAALESIDVGTPGVDNGTGADDVPVSVFTGANVGPENVYEIHLAPLNAPSYRELMVTARQIALNCT